MRPIRRPYRPYLHICRHRAGARSLGTTACTGLSLAVLSSQSAIALDRTWQTATGILNANGDTSISPPVTFGSDSAANVPTNSFDAVNGAINAEFTGAGDISTPGISVRLN